MRNPLLLVAAGLPVLQLFGLRIFGVRASAADLLAVLCLGLVVVSMVGSPRGAGRIGATVPPLRAVLALVALVAWIVLGARVWGSHPLYGLARATGVALWGSVALLVATSWTPLRRWARWWLWGAAAVLFVTGALVVIAPEVVTYRGGASLAGLPRLRGTFVHPNLFGDWLLVTMCIAAGVWAADRAEAGGLGRATTGGATEEPEGTAAAGGSEGGTPSGLAWIPWFLLAAGVAFVAAIPSAALGAGVAIAYGALRLRRPALRAMALAAGVGLAAVTLVGATGALRIGGDALSFETTGVRPAIWAGAWEAVRAAPLLGVGAAPFLAEASDPLRPGAAMLWDAHSTPLSLVGQYGVVGLVLFGWVIFEVFRAGRVGGREEAGGGGGSARGGVPGIGTVGRAGAAAEGPLRVALVAALLGAAAHATITASEDFRHLWVLLGIAAVARRR